MAKAKLWQNVYLFQHGAIRCIRAYPTRMGRMWRDELGREYPVSMVKTELTDPRDISKYEETQRLHQAERNAWSDAKHRLGV